MSCGLRVAGYGLRDETILYLNFINDTYELNEKEMSFFLDSYNELGRKINTFIQYVDKNRE